MSVCSEAENYPSKDPPRPLTIDPKRWREGFQDAYAGRAALVAASDDNGDAAVRVDGKARRLRHREEFERALFVSSQVRPIPKGAA